jgi:virginiamycin A acetyltransferase
MTLNKLRKKLRRFIYKVVYKFAQHNEMESVRLRDLYKSLYNVEVGMYSYGCFKVGQFDANTYIGRYCSISSTARRMSGNHGKEYLTLHPYVYNVSYGLVDRETIVRGRCVIEDDVWLGHNSVILPSVKKIGRGAIVGAGTILTKDVPKYSIVVGNPGRVIGYRFDEALISMVESSKWWNMDKQELATLIKNDPDTIYQPQTKNNIQWEKI